MKWHLGPFRSKKQVLANKDASPFLCCFVVVVEVVMVAVVIVVAVVWMHTNHNLSLLYISL